MKSSLESENRKMILAVLLTVWAGGAMAATDHSAGPAAYGHPTLQLLVVSLAFILCGCLIWKKRAKLAVDTSRRTVSPTSASGSNSRPELAEEEDFSNFLKEFKPGSTEKNQRETTTGKAPSSADALKEFFAWAPDQTTALQRLASKCKGRTSSDRQAALSELAEKLAALKSRASLPELRPAWELATALEGFLKQLTRDASNINYSTLRTLENGVGLLADLCVPEVRADLAANPAIKILVVDDDQISTLALTSAIKRAFDEPDQALSGEAAVDMANQQRYDLIMLDVMMPGLDGFAVCAKIRETVLNRSTPVLFVTTLKDFDTRAKLLVGGGNEVMGKPFMAFEITVKALTMIFRSRLRNGDNVLHVARESVSHSNPAVNWPSLNQPASEPENEAVVQLPDSATSQDMPLALMPPPVKESNPQQLSEKFIEYIPSFVAEVKRHVAALDETDESAVRKELSIRLHLKLQFVSRRMDVPLLRPAFEVSRSLEGLFKKFAENPKNITETSLRTATAGLELLKDLCKPGVRQDLAHQPPIRLLVVDDEPLARRALTGALQMSFSKPLTAESAEEALKLAEEHEFDVIFMDICLPGMDGFAACSKIHETFRNRITPVLFVTSLSDEEFRARAAMCGGSDFVVKPFIFMEINLKALTIALRGRLEAQSLNTPPATA